MVKNLPASAGSTRDAGLTPGSGRSPGGVNYNPLQYSCLGNQSHEERSLAGYSRWGHKELALTEHTHTLYLSHITLSFFPHPQISQAPEFFPNLTDSCQALAFDLLHLKILSALKQQSRIYLAPETGFHEDNFSTEWGCGGGDGLGVIPAHLLCLSVIINQLHFRSSGIRSQRLGIPALILSLFLM